MSAQAANMDTRRFLAALFGKKPAQPYLLIWTLPGKTSHWFQSPFDASDFVGSQTESDIYVGVALASQKRGPDERCKSDETAGIVGLWVDIDLKSEAHFKPNLPATVQEAKSILPSNFPPTALVETGNGLHAWWLFKEPWMFENDADRVQASKLASRFQTLLKHTAQCHGFHLDRLADLARVLRVPGTMNWKDRRNPKSVTLQELNEHRYSATDFDVYLDELGIEDEDATRGSAKTLITSEGGTDFTIDLSAAIENTRLEAWLTSDEQFRSTWDRARTDLTDQSNSGYDMALAHFGVKKGLTDQEIVTLISQHRRRHGNSARKAEDYFRRTLSKARTLDQRPKPTDGQTNGGGSRARSGDPWAKAKLWEQLTVILGIEVMRMRKVQGADPVFLLDLAECCVEIDSIETLMSQKAVAAKIAAQANYIVPRFSPAKWREIAQMMLDACILSPTTADLGLGGAAEQHIDHYLGSRHLYASAKEITIFHKHEPVIQGNRILISLLELRRCIVTHSSQSITPQKVATMLTVIGANPVRLRDGGLDQERWALPAEKFDPAAYAAGDHNDN